MTEDSQSSMDVQSSDELMHLVNEAKVLQSKSQGTSVDDAADSEYAFIYLDQALKSFQIRYLVLAPADGGEKGKVHFGASPEGTTVNDLKLTLPAQGQWCAQSRNQLEVQFNVNPDKPPRPHTFMLTNDGVYRCTQQRNLLIPFPCTPPAEFNEFFSSMKFRYFHEGRHECLLHCTSEGHISFQDIRVSAPPDTATGVWQIVSSDTETLLLAKFGRHMQEHTFRRALSPGSVWYGKFTGCKRILIFQSGH